MAAGRGKTRPGGTRPVKPVVIVGGGLSGLAVALSLSLRRIPTVLFEQKPSPGGRTRSFVDPVTGDTLDNGQHTLIAGYRSTFRYLHTIGTADLVRVQPRAEMRMHHPSRGFCTVTLPLFWPPWNAAAGIARTNLLSPADRFRLLHAGSTLVRWTSRKERNLADRTITDWLSMTGQSKETRHSFWDPLAVSIMNEHCASASAALFLRSLRQAFFAGPRSAAFALPTVGLSDLMVKPAVALIERQGGAVYCRADVVATSSDHGSLTGVRLRDGTFVEAAAAVLAVPPASLPPLLPPLLKKSPLLEKVTRAPHSPIVSIFLWFERDFMRAEEILGLVNRRIQWVFNRRTGTPVSAAQSSKTTPAGFLCAVISAAHAFADLSNDELTRIAIEDLRTVFGEAVSTPVRSVVIRERRATFSSTPAYESLRPSQRTAIANLFLAGDWTDTGLPATIEGALISAEKCVSFLLASRGNEAPML